MPQCYTLQQSKNAYQHLAALNDPNIDFFKQERTQITLKWFSSSCFILSRTPYAMDAMHR